MNKNRLRLLFCQKLIIHLRYNIRLNEKNDKIDAVFPGSKYYAISEVRHIIYNLSTSLNFYIACERAYETEEKLSREYAARMERKMREEKENEYRQAVLNEQRRTNENLENLQRQQEYANRLAREEEYRRNYEDLKEKVNRKWGE